MITINNLTVNYAADLILDDLSLLLEENQIHDLAGLNGTGKTTLLNTLYGLKKPEKGEVKRNDTPLTRKEIAYLEAENFFYPGITGYEYLSLFYHPKNGKEFVEKINSLFKLPLNRLIEEYSTGMKKKLAIIALFLQDKEIFILDEPYNGLDIESSKILALILLRLKKAGKTILITSHILESLTEICDSIHYLKDGKILFSKERSGFDTLNEIIDKEIIKRYHSTLLTIFK